MKNNTKYYIGYSLDKDIRKQSSSGGIGTSVQKYLLASGSYGTSITFSFNKEKCMYEPQLIFSPSEVVCCGSIYQDINIFRFVKDNISKIRNGIVLTCPPCQVKVIRQLFRKNDIPNFIISYCCSGQTTIEGTWCYYRFLGIRKENIVHMQYRGNGWPGGIQIRLNNGDMIFRPNYTDPWKTIHSASLFRPKRCFYCVFDTSYDSEISIADPWLKEYLENDSEGSTMMLVNTELGEEVIAKMEEDNLIEIQSINREKYEIAQKPNVEKKNRVRNQRKYIKTILYFIEKPWIHSFFSKNLNRMKLFLRIRYMILPSTRKKYLKNMATKLTNKCRYYFYCRKIGSHNGNFNIMGGGNSE